MRGQPPPFQFYGTINQPRFFFDFAKMCTAFDYVTIDTLQVFTSKLTGQRSKSHGKCPPFAKIYIPEGKWGSPNLKEVAKVLNVGCYIMGHVINTEKDWRDVRRP